MPYKNPEVAKERHREYMRLVWYPRNKKRHIEAVRVSKTRRRKGLLARLKHGRRCAECPETEPVALDFHHVDTKAKEFTIRHGFAQGYSEKRIMAEIAKCILLCANCHRKVHYVGAA